MINLSGEVLNILRGYLDQLGVKYLVDQEKNRLIAPGFDVEGKKFGIITAIVGSWVVIHAHILPKDKIPSRAETDVYKIMLHANFSYPEIRYNIDDEGNLGTSQTIPLSGLNFEGFKSEYAAVFIAVKRFITEIAPKFNIEI